MMRMGETDMTIYLNIRPSGYIELLTSEGAWVGPCVGGFGTSCEAIVWAARNGYEVAQ